MKSKEQSGQPAYKEGTRRSRLIIAFVIVLSVSAVIWAYERRWDLYMLKIPDMHDFSINTNGYTLELLPFNFSVSFIHHKEVYFADGEGRVFKANDRDPVKTLTEIGHSKMSPRMLFVSSKGTIFVGSNDPHMKRSIDGGKTWEQVLDLPFWRMDEDRETNTLYAGNYSPRKHPVDNATLFKSFDEGKIWEKVFIDNKLDHIHSVRYDSKYRRIYISVGDESSRGVRHTRTIRGNPGNGLPVVGETVIRIWLLQMTLFSGDLMTVMAGFAVH